MTLHGCWNAVEGFWKDVDAEAWGVAAEAPCQPCLQSTLLVWSPRTCLGRAVAFTTVSERRELQGAKARVRASIFPDRLES